jgi:UDP-N-acetylglucosamine 2-epimerase (non-hydrolysing)
LKPHLLFYLGTRPEAIKLGPVIRQARGDGSFKVSVCLSGQHQHMALPMLRHFGIQPDVTLAVPRKIGNLPQLISASAANLYKLFERVRPDMLVVQGDTTSAMVGAICAFSERLPLAHVEAGLRSGDFMHPFPEEFNRRVIGLAATLHFCPTRVSASNLVKEGVNRERIRIVGNSCIDALFWTLANSKPRECFSKDKMGILVTNHRRENWQFGIANLCHALDRIARASPNVEILFAVHLNPNVRSTVHKVLGKTERVRLTEPLDYATFCRAMKQARLIITDSGGIQEEALALGTPTLVTRKVTERPEVLKGGTVQIVGNNSRKIIAVAKRILTDPSIYRRLHRPRFPFGRGNTSEKIVRVLRSYFTLS